MDVTVSELSDRREARALHRVNARAWRVAYADVLPESALPDEDYEPSEGRVEATLSSAGEMDGVVLVARDGERVVGFGEFRWGDDDTKAFVADGEAELRAIYVDPGDWGGGAGTRLLEAGIDRLPGATTLKLEALSGNDVGRSFYRSRGFERVGDHEFTADGEAYPTVVYARDT